MRTLPIYPETPLPALQRVEAANRDVNCTSCNLHKTTPAGQRCLPSEGEAGDILVVMGSPGEFERRLGRPAAGSGGRWIRSLLARVAPGRKVVYTTAVGCRLDDSVEEPENAAVACRKYQHMVFQEAKPQAIILLDTLAGISYLDRTYQALSVRLGYSWAFNPDAVPVFLFSNPNVCIKNRLIAKAFEEDLKRALSGELDLNREALTAKYHIVESDDDAHQAWLAAVDAPYLATDVESSGMMFEKDFRIECLAVSMGKDTYVYPRKTIEDHPFWISRILRDFDHSTWNGQFDWNAIEQESCLLTPKQIAEHTDGLVTCHSAGLCCTSDYGKLNLQSDGRLKRKIIAADARADLSTAAELVGMGSHKGEQHKYLEIVVDELRKLALATQLTPKGKARKNPALTLVRPDEVDPSWMKLILAGYSEQKFAHRFIPESVEHRYVAMDACATWYLEGWANRELMLQDDLGQYDIWEEVTKPAMWAWARATLSGFPIDKSALQLFSDYLKAEAEVVLKKIQSYSPNLNPRSSKQVGAYLNSLGIKSKRKTDSGAQSFAKDVLEELKDKHPIIPLLLQYTLLTHTDSNFAEGMLNDIRSDGKVHASFLLDGTGTGRPSSHDPNMFNQLKGRDAASRELGNMLRACYVVGPDEALIEADMGQIEIRMAANRSQDPAMKEMLNSGVDFHTRSTELFGPAMGKDVSKMSKEERDIFREQAKTCIAEGELVLTNYGLVPIESVDSHSLVWDGVEWVAHDGVMFMGYKEVVTYDCLTATSDHEVYLHDGTKLPFSEVVSSGRRLARSGDGEAPVGITFPDGESSKLRLSNEASTCGMSMLDLRADTSDLCDEHQAGPDEDLQVPARCTLRNGPACEGSGNAILSDALSLHSSHQSNVRELRPAWDRVQICFTGRVHPLGFRASTAPNVSWCGHRSDRQLGPLRTWESAPCLSQGESLQQANQSPCSLSGAASDPISRLAPDEAGSSRSDVRCGVHRQTAIARNGTGGSAPATARRWSKVYDIINAGPRHRFTVSGRLVSNCNFACIYEIPSQLGFMLSKRLNVKRDVADKLGEALFKSYTQLRPYMDKCYAEAWENGYSRTHWKGRPARKRPLWGMGKNPRTLRELETALAGERKGPGSETAFDVTEARATYNGDVQGSAVDIVTSLLWPIQLWLDANTDGARFVLQIYDSIMILCKKKDKDKVLAYLLPKMKDELEPREGHMDGVPLTADAKEGGSWSTLKKVAQ